MDVDVLVGLVVWLALTTAPIAVWAVLLHGEAVVRGLARLGRLLGLGGLARLGARVVRRPTPVVSQHRPLQDVAADLRRLYPAVHAPVPGTRMAKQRGVVLAYDEHLAAASSALEVPTSLLQLAPGGVDREIERLRVELALTDAGLVLG